MPTGDGIAEACGKSSSASARHGSSGRIFVRDKNSQRQEIRGGIVATKAHTCDQTIKYSGGATVEAAMASASEFGTCEPGEVLLDEMPGAEEQESKTKAQLRHIHVL